MRLKTQLDWLKRPIFLEVENHSLGHHQRQANGIFSGTERMTKRAASVWTDAGLKNPGFCFCIPRYQRGSYFPSRRSFYDSLRNSWSRSKISKGMVFPFPIDVTQGLDWKFGRKIKPFWWFIIIWSTLEISMLVLGYTPSSDTTMFKILHGKIPICTRYFDC